jgi:uncharacterized protein (TIGR03083 family)
VTLDYLAHLRRESARFAAALRDAAPDARVPTCPQWSADDLLWHLGGAVYPFWSAVVRLRDIEAVEAVPDPQRPAEHAELLEACERGAAELVELLEAVPDDEPMWTWSSDHTVGFIKRRMAHELLIHRVDAEVTVNARTEVDAELAADGIAESLEFFLGGVPEWAAWDGGAPSGPVGAVELTDTGRRFLVQVGSVSGTSPGGRRYEAEPGIALLDTGESTFTVRGSAVDLDLWLWNRPPFGDVEVGGSAPDYAQFEAVVRSGVSGEP